MRNKHPFKACRIYNERRCNGKRDFSNLIYKLREHSAVA